MGHNRLINTCAEIVLVLPLKTNSSGLTNRYTAYIQWEIQI